jgi:hypothetical protein
VIQPVISQVKRVKVRTYSDTLGKLEHLLRYLMFVLLARRYQDTLQRLGLLPELQEYNLGSLRSHIMQPSPKDDILSNHLFTQLRELEPCPSGLFLTLVQREFPIVLRSIVDRGGCFSSFTLFFLSS